MKRLRQNSGFTLIELMIVVAIVGILVSIATPKFQKYLNKAKQAEAKLALSSLYQLEKAFYGEYSAYIPSTQAIGFVVEGYAGGVNGTQCPTVASSRHFYQIGWNTSIAFTNSITGYTGTTSSTIFMPSWSCNSTPGWNWNTGSSLINQGDPPHNVDDPQSFLVSAKGDLNPSGVADNWTIDETKNLKNTKVGL